jgi:hypothetical protein
LVLRDGIIEAGAVPKKQTGPHASNDKPIVVGSLIFVPAILTNERRGAFRSLIAATL